MSKKIDIISLYLGDYVKSMSGREIARNLKVNHQTALNHLNDMVKSKILVSKTKGRNKEYSLNLSKLDSRMIIEASENIKSFHILNNSELRFIISEILQFTQTIVLFGSFASRKQDKGSDVDLILLGKSDKSSIDRIRRRYNREINIEYLSYDDFAKSLRAKKALAIEILKNHAIYGNLSKVVEIFLRWYTR
ncbi:MAG: nucleotidyltransferase domain-containing protein [Nanoarchaeota archaeon]|nr:nucleotidyltransferase domain-containing protein [Nanoarchaeota archaeon]